VLFSKKKSLIIIVILSFSEKSFSVNMLCRRMVLVVAMLFACFFAGQGVLSMSLGDNRNGLVIGGGGARRNSPLHFSTITAAAWGQPSKPLPTHGANSKGLGNNALIRALNRSLTTLRYKVNSFFAQLTPDNVFSTVIYASVFLYVGNRIAQVGESFPLEKIGDGFTGATQSPLRMNHKIDW
jgi:hypothetical protein